MTVKKNKLKLLFTFLMSLFIISTITTPNVSADTPLSKVVENITKSKEDEKIKNAGEGWDLFVPYGEDEGDGAVLTQSTMGIYTGSYDSFRVSKYNGENGQHSPTSLETSAQFANTLRELGLDYSFTGSDTLRKIGRFIMAIPIIIIFIATGFLGFVTDLVFDVIDVLNPLTWMTKALELASGGSYDPNTGTMIAQQDYQAHAFDPIINQVAAIIYWVSQISTLVWVVILFGSLFSAFTNIGSIKPNAFPQQNIVLRVVASIWNFIKAKALMIIVPLLILTAAGEISKEIRPITGASQYTESFAKDVYSNWFYYKHWAQNKNMAIPSGIELQRDASVIDPADVLKMNQEGAGLLRFKAVDDPSITNGNKFYHTIYGTGYIINDWVFGDKYSGNTYESYIKRQIKAKYSDNEDAVKNPIQWLTEKGKEPYNTEKYQDFIGKFNNNQDDTENSTRFGANLTYNKENKTYTSNGDSSLSIYGMYNYLNIRADKNTINYSHNALLTGDAYVVYHAHVTYVPGMTWYGFSNYVFIIVKALVITLVTLGLGIQAITAMGKANADFLSTSWLFSTGNAKGVMSLISAVIAYLTKLFTISMMYAIIPTTVQILMNSVDDVFTRKLQELSSAAGNIKLGSATTLLPLNVIDENMLGFARFFEAVILVILVMLLMRHSAKILMVINNILDGIMNSINQKNGVTPMSDNLKNALKEPEKPNKHGNDPENPKDGTEKGHDLDPNERRTLKDTMKDVIAKPLDKASDAVATLQNYGKDFIDGAKDVGNLMRGNLDAERHTRTKEQFDRDLEDKKAALANTKFNMDSENKNKQKTADFDSMGETSKELAKQTEEARYESVSNALAEVSASPDAMAEALTNQAKLDNAEAFKAAEEAVAEEKEVTDKLTRRIETLASDVGEEDIDVDKVQDLKEEIKKTLEINSEYIQGNQNNPDRVDAERMINASAELGEVQKEVKQAYEQEKATNTAIQSQISETSHQLKSLKENGAPQEEIQQAQQQLDTLTQQKGASDQRVKALAETHNQVAQLATQEVGQSLKNIGMQQQNINSKAITNMNAYDQNQTAANLEHAIMATNTATGVHKAAQNVGMKHRDTISAIREQVNQAQEASQVATQVVHASQSLNRKEGNQEMAKHALIQATEKSNIATHTAMQQRANVVQAAQTLKSSVQGFREDVSRQTAIVSKQDFNGLGQEFVAVQESKQRSQEAQQKVRNSSGELTKKIQAIKSKHHSVAREARDNAMTELSYASFDNQPVSGRWVHTPKNGKRLTNGEFRKEMENYQQVISAEYDSPETKRQAVMSEQKRLASLGVSPNMLTSTPAVNQVVSEIKKQRTNFTKSVMSNISKDNTYDWAENLSQRDIRMEADYQADMRIIQQSGGNAGSQQKQPQQGQTEQAKPNNTDSK